MSRLLLLALYSAAYPTLAAAIAILLAQPRRLALVSAYVAGAMTMSLGAGLVIVYALNRTGLVVDVSISLSWGTEIAIGGLAVLVAVALSTHQDEKLRARRRARRESRKRRADTPEREPWSTRMFARGSVPIVFAVALPLNLPGAAYVLALRDIAADGYGPAEAVLLVVGFNLIMYLLAEIPLLGLLLFPERVDALVARAQGWFSAHGRRVAIVGCAVVGALFVVRGIVTAIAYA